MCSFICEFILTWVVGVVYRKTNCWLVNLCEFFLAVFWKCAILGFFSGVLLREKEEKEVVLFFSALAFLNLLNCAYIVWTYFSSLLSKSLKYVICSVIKCWFHCMNTFLWPLCAHDSLVLNAWKSITLCS